MGIIDHPFVGTLGSGAGSSPGHVRSGRRISTTVMSGVIQCFDVALLVACGLALWPLAGDGAAMPARMAAIAILVGSLVVAWTLQRRGAYAAGRLQSLRAQLQPIGLAGASGAAALAVALFLIADAPNDLRILALCWAVMGIAGLVLSRAMLCPVICGWAAAGRLARRVAVIGVGPFSETFITRLQADPQSWEIVGIYDDRMSRIPSVHAGTAVRGTVEDLVQQSRMEKIDVIVVALPLSAVARIAHILDQVASAVADICLTTDLAGLHYGGQQFTGIGGNAVVSIKEDPLKDWRAVRKIVFDRGLAALILLMLSPVMAAIALLIKLDSPGPVIFRQPRLGFNNRIFSCFKFRTMHHAMTDRLADQQTTRDDKRITRTGRWLRRLSLDELPQLICVLQGTMSLVGPRPHAPNTKAADRLFGEVVAQYAVRHRVKPGITGWAQVNGLRGETQTVAQIEARVAHDLYYIEHWSLALDVRIMLLTVIREFWSSHAY